MSDHDHKTCDCNECMIRRWREVEAEMQRRHEARKEHAEKKPN